MPILSHIVSTSGRNKACSIPRMGTYCDAVSIWSCEPILVINKAGMNSLTQTLEMLFADDASRSLNWAAMTPVKMTIKMDRLA